MEIRFFPDKRESYSKDDKTQNWRYICDQEGVPPRKAWVPPALANLRKEAVRIWAVDYAECWLLWAKRYRFKPAKS